MRKMLKINKKTNCLPNLEFLFSPSAILFENK